MYRNFYQRQNIENRRQHLYALVMYLPEELDRIIAPVREKFDPLHSLVASHISVVFPFDSTHSIEELTAIVQTEIKDETEIPITMGSILDFYPRSPIISWKVENSERVTSLYYRLHSRLGLAVPFKDFQPHVTVAREISPHRVMMVKEQVVPYLPSESFLAGKLDLITPLDDQKWVSVRTFQLLSSD